MGSTPIHSRLRLGEVHKTAPEGFYRGLGFEPTGDFYGDEPEVKLVIEKG